jgi:hypothetical protein
MNTLSWSGCGGANAARCVHATGRATIACLQIFAQLAELRPAGALSRNFAALLGVSTSPLPRLS